MPRHIMAGLWCGSVLAPVNHFSHALCNIWCSHFEQPKSSTMIMEIGTVRMRCDIHTLSRCDECFVVLTIIYRGAKNKRMLEQSIDGISRTKSEWKMTEQKLRNNRSSEKECSKRKSTIKWSRIQSFFGWIFCCFSKCLTQWMEMVSRHC